jgi:hypothetical protein
MDLADKKLNEKSLAKNQILTFILLLNKKKYKELTFEEFKELLPIDVYLFYESKKEAIKADPFYNKKRKNPFYDFENIIQFKDKVIVPKKAWTAIRRPELQNRSSIEVLIDFFNSNKDIFNVVIKPVE